MVLMIEPNMVIAILQYCLVQDFYVFSHIQIYIILALYQLFTSSSRFLFPISHTFKLFFNLYSKIWSYYLLQFFLTIYNNTKVK